MHSITGIVVSGLAVCLAGCETTTSTYADWTVGSARNTPDHAMLKCLPHVQVISFDGDKRKRVVPPQNAFSAATCIINISPGPHTAVLRYEFTFMQGRFVEKIHATSGPISFVAKPGGKYLLRSIGSDRQVGKAKFSIISVDEEE